MRTFFRTLLATVAIALLAACGGGSEATTAPAPTTTSTVPAATVTTEALVIERAQVARSDAAVDVYANPGDAAPAQVLPATTEFGSARALLVEQERGDWLEVQLPVRPNGSTGWIRRSDVELRTVDEAVTVDLAARTMTVSVNGATVLTTSVAIGTPDAPTPTGRYYIVDKLATPQEGSAYGPFAFGLSGHSDVLTDFAGGDGQIGIHGTNQPSSIGQAASHGCVRVPNDIAVQLNDLLPLGTPVTIV